MMVDPGKVEIFVRKPAEPLERLIDAETALLDRVKELTKPRRVHLVTKS
jgi:hypothetical protein